MDKRIDPKVLISELTVEELCETAEAYFQAIPDPTPLMAKPFSTPQEAVELLGKMGLVLAGLQLGKGMTILDFGAGTCWFSRFLNQLQCTTISVDVSPTALDIGRQLFERMPVLGGSLAPPTFVPFDGRRMAVANQTADRIISFDAFHHVPNQQDVLHEFYRVLKPGGIVGFSEPGLRHSRAPQSQYEMRHYKVLENDILLGEIKSRAEKAGFTDLYVKPVSHPHLNLSYKEYERITSRKKLPRHLSNWIATSMQDSTVFFLTKGERVMDSRSHMGLTHQIRLSGTTFTTGINQPLRLPLRIANTGQAHWLHTNVRDIGVVKVGAHLYDSQQRLLELDFYRHMLAADVAPKEEIQLTIEPVFTEPGDYYLAIDLVSEHICWFENVGSRPVMIQVQVT
jgi:ubiquinone/menaquinone biosynthesis C-methylase UbiE